jgi:hypothetical protein
MHGWDNSAGCWFLMNIYSVPIAPYLGYVYWDRYKLIFSRN